MWEKELGKNCPSNGRTAYERIARQFVWGIGKR